MLFRARLVVQRSENYLQFSNDLTGMIVYFQRLRDLAVDSHYLAELTLASQAATHKQRHAAM
jgi:hypothetical protein